MAKGLTGVIPHTSIAGQKGEGTTLILGIAIFALWFSITKRLPRLTAVVAGPNPASIAKDPEPGTTGTGTNQTPVPNKPLTGWMPGENPFLPKWDPTWGPVPKTWGGPK